MLRASKFISKYLPFFVLLSIVLGLIIGDAFPDGVKLLKPFVPIPLFFMLFPMMIGLKVEEVTRAAENYKLLLTAIILNFVVLPPLGALYGYIFIGGLDPQMLAGFILKVTVPCSGMVAAWTGFAKADVGSALLIVAVSLVLGIVVIPIWMVVLAGMYIYVDPLLMSKSLLIIVLTPLLAGLITRKWIVIKYGRKRFEEIKPVLPATSSIGMYAIVFIAMALNAQAIITHSNYILYLIPAVLLRYTTFFLIAILVAKLIHLPYKDGMALGYGVTAKNHSITLALAITTIGGLASFPPSFAPMIQIPMMILYYKLANRVRDFLNPIPKKKNNAAKLGTLPKRNEEN